MNHRLAIVDHDRCKPKQCARECEKKCPINANGKKCIDIEDMTKAKISEIMCIGCGLCVKACPFSAITIVNLPAELTEDVIHRYGENGFRLYRLPLLRTGQIMGILGANGIGKSTMVKILTGIITPNFEQKGSIDMDKYIRKFGATIKKYFKDLKHGLKVSIKFQDMQYYVDRDPVYAHLSGGEQQLRVCREVADSDADVYIFDEPTNYLDIKQRLVVANLIQNLRKTNRYIIVIDHDISFLDYCSDVVSVMYGVPGAYGVISKPYTAPEGINNYFEGYLPAENMRFRDKPFNYNRNLENMDLELKKDSSDFCYPEVKVQYQGFQLHVPDGSVPSKASVTIILGQNGTGKTSFLKNLHQQLELSISIKPQYPKFKSTVTVQTFLLNNAPKAVCDQMFISDVVKPLSVHTLMDRQVDTLSGGEQQRLAVVSCLAQNKDIYFLDEPSAMLDIEQRVNLSRVVARFSYHNDKAIFIVEHDISVALSIGRDLNSHVIVFDKELDGSATASVPMNMQQGMNIFLKKLNVTFRRNEVYKRHRINKEGSVLDKEQRSINKYFMD